MFENDVPNTGILSPVVKQVLKIVAHLFVHLINGWDVAKDDLCVLQSQKGSVVLVWFLYLFFERLKQQHKPWFVFSSI